MATRALATIGTGKMQGVLNQSLHSFRYFGEKYGFDVVVGSGDDADGRPPAWGKVRLIRRLLDSYETVLWIDSDAVIIDASVDPTTLLGPEHFQAMVRHSWDDIEVAYTGVWIFRSCPESRDFLDAVWANEDCIHHRGWEQSAAMQLLGFAIEPPRFIAPTAWTKGTYWLENEWNYVPQQDNSLLPARIRHYAAESNRTRARQIKSDIHAVLAADSVGIAKLWHRMLLLRGAVEWRIIGGYQRKRWIQTTAYRIAKAFGVVKLVRLLRRLSGRGRNSLL